MLIIKSYEDKKFRFHFKRWYGTQNQNWREGSSGVLTWIRTKPEQMVFLTSSELYLVPYLFWFRLAHWRISSDDVGTRWSIRQAWWNQRNNTHVCHLKRIYPSKCTIGSLEKERRWGNVKQTHPQLGSRYMKIGGLRGWNCSRRKGWRRGNNEQTPTSLCMWPDVVVYVCVPQFHTYT